MLRSAPQCSACALPFPAPPRGTGEEALLSVQSIEESTLAGSALACACLCLVSRARLFELEVIEARKLEVRKFQSLKVRWFERRKRADVKEWHFKLENFSRTFEL